MPNKEITDPSMGSNDLGKESLEENLTADILAGTNTQLRITALGGKKNRKNKKPGDDQQKEKKSNADNTYLEAGETDE